MIGGSIFVPVEGIPIGKGAELNIIPDNDLQTSYYGITTMTGIATSAGWEAHAGQSGTITIFSFNIFDVGRDVYRTVMEW